MALFDKLRSWRGSPPREPVPAGSHGGNERRERRARPRVNASVGTRVLVVDDSATILALMRRMLSQNGYLVIEATNVAQALERITSTEPELIFLDIVLPDGDGFQVLRQLRRQAETRDVPIIMMSGNTQATEQFYVQRIGADDFTKKPFSRSEVFSRIEALLDAERKPRRTAQRMGIPAELA